MERSSENSHTAPPLIVMSPHRFALIGFLIGIVPSALFLSLLFSVEVNIPLFKPTEYPVTLANKLFHASIALGLFVLLIIAFLFSARPVLESIRTKESVLSHPLNLLLGTIFFLLITAIIGAIVVDQYPCWIGIPNCD